MLNNFDSFATSFNDFNNELDDDFISKKNSIFFDKTSFNSFLNEILLFLIMN